ncbi:MAG: hypothetical protein KDA96_01810, partial [Planctomycetaceae bacterium]|nr:hypothetical protein [Planctomycetaceae bacterium]
GGSHLSADSANDVSRQVHTGEPVTSAVVVLPRRKNRHFAFLPPNSAGTRHISGTNGSLRQEFARPVNSKSCVLICGDWGEVTGQQC